jgi:raffinose/stachyose/melibiose transport system permease protein
VTTAPIPAERIRAAPRAAAQTGGTGLAADGMAAAPGSSRKRSSRSRGPVAYAVFGGLLVLTLIFLAPLLVIAMNAFKTPSDFAAHGPLALPHGWHFSTITNFWKRVDFGQKLLNSFEISLAVSVLGVLLSLLNAYALSIGRMRGRSAFLVFFLMANVVPQEGLVYPLYYMAKQVHLYDTKIAVIILFTVIQSAFGTYLLSSVLASFPRELVEAAELDGATKLGVLLRVVAPVSWPTLSVLFTFFFIWTWNEFFLPLIFLISNDNQTVPVALALLQGQHTMDVTATSASALLGIVPAIVFFLIFQRTLTRGIAAGAVK